MQFRAAALFSANSMGACPDCNELGVIYTDLAHLHPMVVFAALEEKYLYPKRPMGLYGGSTPVLRAAPVRGLMQGGSVIALLVPEGLQGRKLDRTASASAGTYTDDGRGLGVKKVSGSTTTIYYLFRQLGHRRV